MATITVNQYNDDGTTTRTAGEVLTINGGVFTQRTDTRWHATAPASMVGTFGGNSIISATLGGGFKIDGRNVRWLAYNTGTGNVPPIGTSITQGGVSASYLLGVYASLTAAPTAVGAAMPSTGFIKFREVTGAFASGALTGIGANATGADVLGWLEIVMDQAGNWNVPRLGVFEIRGGWFYLDNTTGVAGQILQVPTNGGGAATECPGVWIEDTIATITGATWTGGVATYTSVAHGLKVENEVEITGISPSGYNVTGRILSATADTFTVAIVSDPGTYSSGGSASWFDFYPALKTTTNFTTTALGTDLRAKFVQNITTGTGTMRIGSDGTSSIGYVPPSGRRTRVPNVFLRQCATGTRATNALPHTTIATRPDFTTTSAGYMDVEYAYGDWYFLYSQPYYAKLHHFATFDSVNISECATALDLFDGFTGMSANLDIYSLVLTSNFAGGEIRCWGGPRGNAPGTTDHDIGLSYCIGQTLTRVRGGIVGYVRSTGQPYYINQCSDITLNYCRSSNGGCLVNTSFNITINNHDHVDRYNGATIATTPYYAVQFTNSCVGVMVNGMTFGLEGVIANCHPYSGLVSAAACSDVYVRNLGTRSAFLNGGSANQPAYIFGDLGNNVNIRCQRCYLVPTRTGAHLSVNSSKNILFEDCYGDFADAITSAGLNMLVRGGGGTNGVTGQASVYGTHFGGAFTSDTVGRIWLNLNEPTAETLKYTSRSFGVGSGFTSAGGLSLINLNDYYICEMQVFKKQHTSFQNAAATLTGTNTGNHSFEYQIDTGSGWGGVGGAGVWNTLNGANLSSETISPSTGFKLKFKITCTTAAATNLMSFVRILTNSTLSDQVNNLYPLTTVDATFSFSGLEIGTEVVLFNSSNVEVAREVITGTTFEYDYQWNDTDGDVSGYYALIWKDDKYPIKFTGITLTSSDVDVPISQADDLVYDEAAVDNVTIDFTNKLVIMDAAAITYDVAGVYSIWKDTILLTNNAQYDFAFSIVGGDTISGVKSIPFYTFLVNDWQVRPDEADHTLSVTGGVLVATGDPFVDTLGAYTVRINYEQPVQAITVSTAGGGGATPAEIWSYATRALTAGGVSAIQSGLATSSELTTLEGNIRGADSDDLKDISDEIAALPTAPAVEDIVDAVWDEPQTDHTDDTTFGKYLDKAISDIDFSQSSAGINASAIGFTLTNGTVVTGTYEDVRSANGVYHRIDDDGANIIDIEYEFNIGKNAYASEAEFLADLYDKFVSLGVYAWNYITSSWEQIGTRVGDNDHNPTVATYNLLQAHVGTGLNVGQVRIRFYGTGLGTAQFSIDQLLISYAVVTRSIGFYGQAVSGTENTVVLGSEASSLDNYYRPGLVTIVSGTGADQYGRVESYDGATRTITIPTTFVTPPDSTSIIQISPWATVRVSEIESDVLDDISGSIWEDDITTRTTPDTTGKKLKDLKNPSLIVDGEVIL